MPHGYLPSPYSPHRGYGTDYLEAARRVARQTIIDLARQGAYQLGSELGSAASGAVTNAVGSAVNSVRGAVNDGINYLTTPGTPTPSGRPSGGAQNNAPPRQAAPRRPRRNAPTGVTNTIAGTYVPRKYRKRRRIRGWYKRKRYY